MFEHLETSMGTGTFGRRAASESGRRVDDACVRAFAPAMRAGNAEMMRGLARLVALPLCEVPAPARPVLIADIRKRHTTMPSGREISHRMQRYMERALMQARLHLMGDPGARGEFELAARQYADRLDIRRRLAATHFAQLESDARTLPGALEWCERLVTKHTPQELERLCLGQAASRLNAAAREHADTGSLISVLEATASFLSAENGPTLYALERVRRVLGAGLAKEGGANGSAGELRFRPRRFA